VWLLLPWALVYGAFFVFPFLFSFVLGFLHYNPLNVANTTFVGAGNVTRLFGDADFHSALRNTLFFVIGTVPVTTTLALALAWLLHAPLPMKDAFKAAMFLPSILSVVVIALLFKLFYAPGGALNETLRALGLQTHGWLTDPATALPAIMAMDIWAAVGYYALVLYAAFTSIPESLYEAATLEGAGHWATFRHVTLPMLKPALGFVLVMTQGGPLGSTNTLVMMLYDTAFRRLDYGYSSVIAYAVFILSGVFSVFALRRMRSQTPVQQRGMPA